MRRVAAPTSSPADPRPDDDGGGTSGVPPLRLAAGLLVGVALWLGFTSSPLRQLAACWPALPVMAIAAAILASPAASLRVGRLAAALRDPSPTLQRRVALGLTVASAGALYGVAAWSGRTLVPKWHDEMSYLTQMQMLAVGRLWMPALRLPEFFDSFHLLAEPAYASMYFPGTALAYVWTVPLGLPGWCGPLAAGAATVGLTYLIACRLTDGLTALGAAAAMLAVHEFRWASLYVISQPAALLLATGAVWAYLRWRERPGAARAAVVGAAFGWLAVTRPLDAVCFALPVGLLMLVDLRRRPARAWLASIGPAVAAALPFLALQVVLNVGVTGDWRRSPYALYHDRHYPALLPGFHDPGPDPPMYATGPPQKRAFYLGFVKPAIRSHTATRVPSEFLGRRLPMLLDAALPGPLAVVLVPLGLAAATRDRRWWAVFAPVPLLMAAYTFYALFATHYLEALAPAGVLAAGLGLRRLAAATPGRWPRAALLSAAAGAALGSLPLPGNARPEDQFDARETVYIEGVLDALPGPSLVLFRYPPGGNYHVEPVYNDADPLPDLARVVRAHDRGPDNARIVRYYGALQPGRRVYRFDRGTGRLQDLGTAGELLARLDAAGADAAGRSP